MSQMEKNKNNNSSNSQVFGQWPQTKNLQRASTVALAGALPSVVLLAGLALLGHHEPVLPEDVGARLEH